MDVKANSDEPFADSPDIGDLSIALIGPDEHLRARMMAVLAKIHGGEVRDFPSYPPKLEDIPHLLDQKHDVIMIELDSDPGYALEVTQAVCSGGKSTVMIYSKMSETEIGDPDLLMRCMRKGAREFLSAPFSTQTINEALERAALRRPPSRETGKVRGRLLVFCGAKGGAGVTNIACNFGMVLARQSGQKTLLIDLDLPLGDTALDLGVKPRYSTIDALQNYHRLDSSFLTNLLVWHESGLAVLPAPGHFPAHHASDEAIDRLLRVSRQAFENVVVDAGSKFDLANGCDEFKEATAVYLVTQCGIPELRNANRLIAQYAAIGGPKLEIVLNRYEPGDSGISEEDIRKALTREASWRVPNDYRAVRNMQDMSEPVIGSDSLISHRIEQMVRAACGLPQEPEKKKGFSFKHLFKRQEKEPERAENAQEVVGLGLANALEISRDGTAAAEETISNNEVPEAPEATPVERQENQQEESLSIYEGNVYERGADGSWKIHSSNAEVAEQAPEIEWSDPEPIVYGTPLSSAHYDAKASVPGRFYYTPGEGIMLPAGAHSLWVTFIPDDAPNVMVHACRTLSVRKAKPEIDWPAPAPISSGTPLTSDQLNATASVDGTFDYVPAAGEVPGPGLQRLRTYFVPADPNYAEVQAEVQLEVTEPTVPLISWNKPADIIYGTPLSSVQLNAVGDVPGTLSYSPAEGTVLLPGRHLLSVLFTPTNSRAYRPAQAKVEINVTKAVPSFHPFTAAKLHSVGTSSPQSTVRSNPTGMGMAAGRRSEPTFVAPSGRVPGMAPQFPVAVTKTMSVITWHPAGDVGGKDGRGASHADAPEPDDLRGPDGASRSWNDANDRAADSPGPAGSTMDNRDAANGPIEKPGPSDTNSEHGPNKANGSGTRADFLPGPGLNFPDNFGRGR